MQDSIWTGASNLVLKLYGFMADPSRNHAEEPVRHRSFYGGTAAVLLSLIFMILIVKYDQHLSAYEPIAMVAKSGAEVLAQSPLGRARQITNQIKDAATIEMLLLCTYSAHQHNLNDIHLSACWISLSSLSKRHITER